MNTGNIPSVEEYDWPDYETLKQMYLLLFNQITTIVQQGQAAQTRAEELFLQAKPRGIPFPPTQQEEPQP